MTEKEKVEEYLAQVVDRLFDVTMALEANLYYCKARKEKLIEEGKDFNYDQARIDTAEEALRFASGELTMRDMAGLIREEKKELKKQDGMDVV